MYVLNTMVASGAVTILAVLCYVTVGDAFDFSCHRATPGAKTLKVGVGSCNNPRLPQSAWEAIHATDMDTMLFIGDTTYTRKSTVQDLKDSLEKTMESSHFRTVQTTLDAKWKCEAPQPHGQGTCSFNQGMWMVWDDHDFGINDGSGRASVTSYGVSDLEERTDLFKTFSFRAKDTCSSLSASPLPLTRPGVYSSTLLMDPTTKLKVKTVLLDTRSFREAGATPNLGVFSHTWPIGRLSTLAGLALRQAAAWVGLANWDKNALLGEVQWQWLRGELCGSSAQMHIIASSVQVFTGNAFVESWGHYPGELQQLLSLLKECRPSGVLFVSGDVHYGELIGFKGRTVEMTSSGITHSVENSFVPNAVSEFIIEAASSNYSGHKHFTGKNFAMIEIDMEPAGPMLSHQHQHDEAYGVKKTGDESVGTRLCAPAYTLTIYNSAGEQQISERRVPVTCLDDDWIQQLPDGADSLGMPLIERRPFHRLFYSIALMACVILGLLFIKANCACSCTGCKVTKVDYNAGHDPAVVLVGNDNTIRVKPQSKAE
eukprot:m.52994 g.52994  ORF g.52994 m.52994 type:complete len:542 (-) comp11346_c0_seq1:145-1770(-)